MDSLKRRMIVKTWQARVLGTGTDGLLDRRVGGRGREGCGPLFCTSFAASREVSRGLFIWFG